MIEQETGLEIAVVGLAGRFPGGADVDELWRQVLAGQEAITRFTPEELAAAGVSDEERDHPDHVPAHGALPEVDRFDAAFFGYSPRDARLIDPQQRLFLECAWEALERSGHLTGGPDRLVGVYAACSASGYLLHHLFRNPRLDSVSEYELMLANDKDSLPTRVAYHLDLRGPAVAVQTACSSSLVAVHLAAQALLARECDVALAGGAHVRLPAGTGYRYEPGGIMSRDGHCRPFDARATGTVGGDGAALVVLRRLADARRDGDTVYAVIRGSAINNDGRLKVGFTAPGVDGQVAVIRAAQEVAEVDPATIGYVEAHGTGTELGDQIELRALGEAFRGAGDGRCALGSVKSILGHLDVAAGVTGLIKAALALHHRVLPPSPYCTEPHPELAGAGPFRVNTAPLPWPDLGAPPRAAVSSFGIGGTNAHVVLQAAPAPVPAEEPAAGRPQVLVLSARDADALDRARTRLAGHLAEHPETPLADVAYTLQTTRREFPHRLVTVAATGRDAAAQLADRDSALVRTGVAAGTPAGVALLFPGQGAQYAGMGRTLHRTEPVYRAAFDRCADLLRPQLDVDLRTLLCPPGEGVPATPELDETRLTQPALFAVEYALAELLRHRGVRPVALAGHSLGEYVAACLAGVFTLEDALATVAVRGRLMQAQPPGSMLSVTLPADEVEKLLPPTVSVAAANAPRLTTVSGETAAVAAVAAELRDRGVACREVRTSHAFHSAMMEPALAGFAAHLRDVPLRPPTLPVVSNVTGGWLTDTQATDPDYWVRQLRSPVRFSAGAELLLGQGYALLEAGPGRTLATLVRQHQTARGVVVLTTLPADRTPAGEDVAVATAVGRLWLAGAPVTWRDGRPAGRRRVALPTYPFARQRHWVDPPRLDHPAPVAPDQDPPEVGPVAAAPASATDEPYEVVRRIWTELLGVDDIGPHDDFFELGGHSLLGTRVVARIRDALGVDLPPGAIFESPTPAALARTVATLAAPVPAPRRPADDLPPDDMLTGLLAEIRALSPERLARELHLARHEEGNGDG
ncbi:beta-ketoacyl synthase N-terminal-like domain-containing protein [Micromonospora sp. 4G57]|uniref:Beta-ketoacyl synthase N-terminal-like domain-containing protein n=1 Tax=Micromonospora sicca TaxID=2202420 RepID=A0ABU5J6P7_9ACTN|nr:MULTISPECIES: beta-ketoacyl synthase N-terminal-like domain-containing protein [unclassified Micromonospora]MDZ5443027.1 beta-ketoacyl synthase N-terminal-like domain-containing protein [Micromonospora sp. 4G57]MDZ5488261.1 beta-ketoacyl synthase N-terminal-like domain-containing protein [Micromonospora sp. 4G53]